MIRTCSRTRHVLLSSVFRKLTILLLCMLLLPSGCGTNLPVATLPVEGVPDPEAPGTVSIDDEVSTGAPVPPVVVDEPLADPASIANATWGVAVRASADGEDVFLVFGSSFAIDESHLVTNAHVVEGAAELFALLEPDMELVVVQHESRVYCPIEEMYIHPDYDPERFLSTPDVGVLTVDCNLPTLVPVADDETLYSLALLDDVSLCGFPGDVTLVDMELGSTRPRATCLTGNITGFRPFNLNDATTALNTAIIQHDIQTSGGTSGGPIFDRLGRVVAINSAGTTDPTASNRFAIRIDQVWAFLGDIEAGLVAPVDLVPTPFVECPNRSYWNNSYSFGFDPPSEFDGPFADDSPSAGDLFAVDFVFDDLLEIDIGVATAFGTLDSWIDGWVQSLSDGGNILLDLQDIVMPSGVDGTMLEWRWPGSFIDVYSIEFWSVHNGLQYRFWAFMTPSDFVSFGPSVRASFRSVCIE